MTNPAFFWSLANSREMVSVLLWSKIVIVTEDARVTRFMVHQTADEARAEALATTAAAERLGLGLIAANGHRGWEGLTEQVAIAHHLHNLGRQEQALAFIVDGIAKQIIEEGEDPDD